MSKLKAIVMDIEERLISGQTPEYISSYLGIPVSWVTEIEMDMNYSEYSRVCEDPDY